MTSFVATPKQQVMKNYNRLSRWYDWFAFFERDFRRQGIAWLNARKGEILLEIGFGTGATLAKLGQAVGETGAVYGIDVAEGMCQVTRKRIAEARLNTQVHLSCADAVSLPFKTRSLDGVLITFTLEILDPVEISLVLLELHRVLHDEGRICIATMEQAQDPSWMLRLYEWMHTQFPNVADCRPIQITQFLDECGFQVTRANRRSLWGLPVEIVLARKQRHP